MLGPDPAAVSDLADLAAQLDLLRTRAAHGTGRPRISLAELTRRLGLPATSKSTVHSYVTGRTLVPAELLDRIVIALGAGPAEQRQWAEAWYRISAGPRRKPVPTGLPSAPDHLGADFDGRDWAFDRIGYWLAGRESALVITGEPGAGKTALVSRLIAGNAAVSAAHYCRQQDTESLDAVSVILSLAGQLQANVPGYTVGADVLRTEADPRQLYDKVIRQPIRKLGTTAVIVVDALDEAVEGGGGHALVALLARETRMPTANLRLLLTSRPGRALRHVTASAQFDLIEDETDAGGDVRGYAERRLHAGDVPAAAVLARRIASRGKGNFLYARFVLDDLLSRARPITTADIRLPDGLAELYREFLNREIAEVEQDWRLRYRPVLGLLTQARGDGFTVGQLMSLTGLPRSVIEDTLTVCAPYLRSGAAYRIFHQSFRDYLRAAGEHHVYPAEAATTILHWLSENTLDPYAVRHLFHHIVDTARLGVAEEPRALLERVLQDLDFLSAKATVDSAALVTEIDDATVNAGDPRGPAARMAAILKYQAHNLRRWRGSVAQPDFLLQQMHYEATKAGFPELLAEIDRRPVRRLRVAWSHANAGAGHADTVIAVVVTPDGSFMATGSFDHTVQVWDAQGTVVWTIRHPGPVQQVVLLPRLRVASTCEDHVVHICSLTDRTHREFPHPDTVGPMAVLPDGGLVVGCGDGIARIWDVDEVAVRRELIHDDRVTCLAVAGNRLLTGSDDHTAYLWDLADGSLLRHFEHDGPVTFVLPAGDLVITVTADRGITVWNGVTGVRAREFTAPADVRSIGLRDGLVVACGNHVWRWDLGRAGPPEELVRHGDLVNGFLLAGTDMISFSRDNTACLTTDDGVRHVFRHDDWVRDAAVSGRHIVTVSDDRSARWWDRDTGTLVRTLAGNADSVRAITIAPHGGWVVSGSDDGTVRVRDTETGELLRVFRHGGWVRAVGATADLVVSGSDDRTARIWNVRTGECVGTLEHDGPVRALEVGGNGVVTVCDDHLVRVWSGDCVVLRGHTDIVRAVAVSESYVVTGSRDGTAIVWSDSEMAHRLRHPDWVRGVAVAPDERHVVTSCVDGVVRLWDLAGGTLVRELTGHRKAVRDVRISADGTRIVTASGDRTARVWDFATGVEVHRFEHGSWVRAVHLVGRYVVSTSDDRTARVWDIVSGRQSHCIAASHRIACCAIGRRHLAFGTSCGEVLCVSFDPAV
ncbi:AAA family ATPase [Kibdelosporangium persicum]|uniref:NACHT domain-containing protein n=1 Tax=Kibdelosporangium persicum TaxID=2698649 RepID=A0ABX2FAF9_9PSEU|nr:AAA family ATPase [Kibdelosporangium persicum]NRN68272.1 hypothetical protein [Kibdelosporangium persicum]